MRDERQLGLTERQSRKSSALTNDQTSSRICIDLRSLHKHDQPWNKFDHPHTDKNELQAEYFIMLAWHTKYAWKDMSVFKRNEQRRFRRTSWGIHYASE